MAHGHGGARPGAGRKRGSVNTKTAQKIIKLALEKGQDLPLDMMLKVMRDPKANWEDRKWAAQQAAPYVHARLAAHEVKQETTQRYVARLPHKLTSEEWIARNGPKGLTEKPTSNLDDWLATLEANKQDN